MRKLIAILLGVFILIPTLSFSAGMDRYVIQWSAIGTSTTDNVPDEIATFNGSSTGVADQAISIGRSDTVFIACSTLNSDVTNVSTDIDIDVSASNDGTNYDTTGEYYVEDFIDSLADNSQDSDGLTPGPVYVKLRLDNNDGSNTAGVKCRVNVMWQ